MSLSLIQGYSSASEEEEQDHNSSSDNDGEDVNAGEPSSAANHPSLYDRSIFKVPQPSSASGLPSAFEVFSEISGPPQFLNNSVEEYNPARDVDQQQGRHGSRRRHRKEKKDLPTGAVVEAKPQLVGIHERVRSDMDGGSQPPTPAASSASETVKRVPTASNPNAEDAAELLRMCLQCGIPKTFSNARGMVCPVCGDRPPVDPSSESKKKGSTVKDKEKSKRMRGQSSHATWKSETEMQLRQTFD
ncbi:hypothetical protein TanjilG_26642 [Lupinus angustifolius]|uniref:Uncharacterized protein n=1 Tax=Lupinus angustifolius TaxID=3871 RepID=A0A1J7GNR9_LUPAN|nr:PREDICTED: uncharacterized protein LOC109360757 [Lupinus angustifolius]XP_019461394.1 PREDICTED: uncharacterized protein LOC109360757 [Lupinus angustifolius]OIW02102.1 hypothetical protein TanjilG_26642 [Lupinus angustifolius]